jgi:hypothetical protein
MISIRDLIHFLSKHTEFRVFHNTQHTTENPTVWIFHFLAAILYPIPNTVQGLLVYSWLQSP